MNASLQQIAGSPLWQLAFVSFAIVLILFMVLIGWRRGIARQLACLGALMAAYTAAFYGGKTVASLAKPFFKMPDAILSILASAVLALVVFVIISALGVMFFKRTRDHASAFVRLLYGLGGAVFGIFFGAFLVWLVVVGVRSVGAVADAQVRQQAADSTVVHAVDVRRRFLDEPIEEAAPLMTSLARLKNSVEMGVIGGAIKNTDVIPSQVYETLGKVGEVVSSPQNAERFLSFPGARELSEHPKIVALRNDKEISDMIAQGRLLELLQDPRIIDAANDPTLAARLKQFDLHKALDYAIQK
jgi:uncharacterized membrane protein required for colicin V production